MRFFAKIVIGFQCSQEALFCGIFSIMKQVFRFLVPLLLIMTACNSSDDKNPDTKASGDSSSVSAEDSAMQTEDSIALVSAPTLDSVQLRFNLNKGKRYDYTMVYDINQEANGRKMQNKMSWKYEMAVLDDKEKVKTIRTTYRQIDMLMNMDGNKMEFSSEKAAEAGNNLMQMPSKMFGAIKGKSFTMKVDDMGRIISVDGFDKIGEAMVNEMNIPEEAKPGMMENFKKQFNDETVRKMFSQSFNIFPNGYVKPGDTWEKDSPLMVGDSLAKTRYTVRSIDGNRVTIDARSTGAINQKSILVVNALTGLVMDGTFDHTASGDRKMTAKGKITGRERK
jgi:hypothetical protein